MSTEITCPTGCTGALPAVSIDLCNPEVHFGNIQKIYFTNPGNPLTNVENPNEWAARISNTGTDADDIRELNVVAEMPEPERNETEISLCRKTYSPGQWTMNVEIDETNDTNYDMMRETFCNQNYLVWFATEAHIYGGNAGIEAQFQLSPIIPLGCTDIQKIMGTLKWKSEFAPIRNTNPL